MIADATTADGFIAGNLLPIVTNATWVNVDIPLTPLSFKDLRSGVAFAATSAVLGLLADAEEPAKRLVGAAGIAGLAITTFDIFVL